MCSTFYSIPIADVTRVVTFSMDMKVVHDVQAFALAWNDPMFGHVLTAVQLQNEENSIAICNCSDEQMMLVLGHTSIGYSVLGIWQAGEVITLHLSTFVGMGFPALPYIAVMQDMNVFKCTAYLYRKKADQPYYIRDDIIRLPKGVYANIGHVAAALNQGIRMRGERNGFVFSFVTRGGKLCMEASHKQPEPSFIEIQPLQTTFGLLNQDVLRLRTKERLEFPYAACCLIL